MNMTYSQNAPHLTEQFERCKLVAYQDSNGVWTIAYGHTRGVLAGMTCTRGQADAWLQEDIQWAVSEVNRLVTVPLTQGEFDVCVDFTFNCGCGNFDHSALLQLINKGDFAAAASQFELWDKCGGKVIAGLLCRLTEAQEFRSEA